MQRAVLVERIGEPVKLGTRPIPLPPEGYVRLQVKCTMLLPHDTYGRDLGLFIQSNLPYVLGTNIAGIVDKVGSGVSSFQEGDLVFGQGEPVRAVPDAAGLQEYAILEADAMAKVPLGFSAEDMVSLPVNATTSFAALFHHQGFNFRPPFPEFLQDGQSDDLRDINLVIIGGGSNVGKLGIQIARLAGFSRIITVASSYNELALKSLGATHVIDRHENLGTIATKCKAIAPEGITHVYDCVSWNFELALSLVTEQRASEVLTLHPCEDALDLVRAKGLSQCSIRMVIGQNDKLQPLLAKFWSQLLLWIKERAITIPRYRIIEGMEVGQINQALDDYRDGRAVDPTVVRI